MVATNRCLAAAYTIGWMYYTICKNGKLLFFGTMTAGWSGVGDWSPRLTYTTRCYYSQTPTTTSFRSNTKKTSPSLFLGSGRGVSHAPDKRRIHVGWRRNPGDAGEEMDTRWVDDAQHSVFQVGLQVPTPAPPPSLPYWKLGLPRTRVAVFLSLSYSVLSSYLY